ncbi:NLP-like protein [Plasmopara halstedii]|uniref:NLP-like protein n=1 Tax=Plasmopara halstedii TaxID=4781 RepID=A0A0P1AQ60_PLAHL|nr:NLP-like protein [Plasmopara halstedii]CEG43310.1 NLP-like protein [Plasmopara halstedii]|eukprot:XP_024579679.1 NLP-like protein [Plasmopara halstedii]
MNSRALLFVLVALLASVRANIAIDANSVQPFPEQKPQTDSERSALKYKPHLHVSEGCHPYPAVQQNGSVSAGFEWDEDYSQPCGRSPQGSQIYSRSSWYKGKWAIMYAWYFPKAAVHIGRGVSGRRHYWLHAIVWTDEENPNNSSILGVTMSAGIGLLKRTKIKSHYIIGGTTLKLMSYVSFWGRRLALKFTVKLGETQDLITWEQLSHEARKALALDYKSDTPLQDYRFDGLIKEAYPF